MRTPALLAMASTIDDLTAPAELVAAPQGPYRHSELAVWEALTQSLLEYPRIWGSVEEGAMVLGEEVDELWEDVRANRIGHARREAAQVGAMAIRFIADLYNPVGPAGDRCRAAMAEQRAVRAAVGPPQRVLSSSHEGFGFLRREYDALWSAVRFEDPARPAAARVAGMAVRFIAEIANESPVLGRVP
ncbi:hypothetical protein BZL29_7716 [Mycobacterium kansasii]|uniref:Uncharacterized protein n=1 Tax=Mycobacterium kansasii TaxID=1768 RepID=A0A1V3WEK7_MYCKA|nr:hypothetical protein BZL29_7716 [Mycobacterium kansasii]